MAEYLVTVATTVYNSEVISADSREDAWLKALKVKVDYNQGDVHEPRYVENIEELSSDPKPATYSLEDVAKELGIDLNELRRD